MPLDLEIKMTEKKTRITAKGISTNFLSAKPCTVIRAGITAKIKLTRGKQLVEHDPFSLIPDPNNPRPGDIIDDKWLLDHLRLRSPQSLCFFDETADEYRIPTFQQLNLNNNSLEEHYSFLRELAFSILRDGIIEPIEIFLADVNNDPEYFYNSDQQFGYVVLEGHQRRLAAMLAGVETVTCIEITDETTLMRLKVKHRKLRRQLSENNLRKNLSVAQNYLIVKNLISTEEGKNLAAKELSAIIGLSEDIARSLILLSTNILLPKEMQQLVESNVVSFRWIKTWVRKDPLEIMNEISRIKNDKNTQVNVIEKKPKARGRSGGAVKRSAIIKINKIEDSNLLQEYLLKKFPEIQIEDLSENSFNRLEIIFSHVLQMAKNAILERVPN